MTVNPGFGGQSYIKTSTRKVESARAMLREAGSDAELQVDGGVDANTAPEVAAAGATVLVAGSAVFGHTHGATAGLGALRSALPE